MRLLYTRLTYRVYSVVAVYTSDLVYSEVAVYTVDY